MFENGAIERDAELHADNVAFDPANNCIKWAQGFNAQCYGSFDPQDRSAIIEATAALGQIEHGDVAFDAVP